MKISILTYLERESDAHSHDVVVNHVAEALHEGGHETSVLGVHDDVRPLLQRLDQQSPELIFNLCEDFGDLPYGPSDIAGLLDLTGVPYTGGGPGELFIQQDKALAKKLLAFESIASPDFAVFSPDHDFETGGNLRMPLFVKPMSSESSIGVDGRALVTTTTDLMERVLRIHREFRDSALAEEYIDGREFYVGVIGNHEPVALPPIEMDFSAMPEGKPHVLDAKAKWDKKSVEYRGTKSVVADIPDELRAKLHKVSLGACRALRVRDYGRVDLRLTDTNEIYVLEVNASCYLERDSEFALAAKAAGLEYPALVNRIVELAVERRRLRAAPPVRESHGK